MGQTFDGRRVGGTVEFFQQFLNERTITDVHFEKFIANGVSQLGDAAFRFQSQLLEENFSG